MNTISNKPVPVVEHKRIWPGIVLACTGLLGAVLFWAWSAGYRFNPTPSLPKGIYRISPGAPGKGDLVSFCLEGDFAVLAKERGYLQPGICPSGLRPLLKRVAGLPGDTVGIGNLVPRAVDSMGRSMPDSALASMPGGRIPQGMALVLSEHSGSFDSRYFGLVPLDSLQRVEPILVFTLNQGE